MLRQSNLSSTLSLASTSSFPVQTDRDFRALALPRRLPPERVEGFVMQASEKPAQIQTMTYPNLEPFANRVRVKVHPIANLVSASVPKKYYECASPGGQRKEPFSWKPVQF